MISQPKDVLGSLWGRPSACGGLAGRLLAPSNSYRLSRAMSAMATALFHVADILQPQWHESVAIRHLDLRQAPRVHHVALLPTRRCSQCIEGLAILLVVDATGSQDLFK